ncbi:aminodeoxyfutalosine synthase [Trichlorobacter thiogenes]|uniref:Aminodeoxyfutalosine synthase n=1 Tax=Trichlorobacter thiogenes TaxID=115783 RepID=A0A1T4MC92_9BACT|nr:aminofutalosine synthase MqnE [Trichlorobacter thiogenes]SJZ64660.1 aminodeoxyfutalosine synthase [Trichlorobacter thiogenes]
MTTLATIKEKVHAGQRLSEDDALALYASNDLLAIGELAAWVNEQKNGANVYFNVNRHINPTNVCVNRCAFCAFSRTADADDAYTLAMDQMVGRAVEAVGQGATEVHLVGGLHPDLTFEFYLELLRDIRISAPSLHIKAFTAVEIDYFAQISQLTVEQVLAQLIEAGLGSMPGGGAEILVEEVRQKICPEKISGQRWLEVHRLAHHAGLKTNATMLYGHVETAADRVRHMALLRELQDQTGGFQVFIPLAWQPENSPLKLDTKGTSGLDDLKTLAIARLFLDNFPHLKAYWIMLGEKIAQVALAFGVDDLDGTVVEEKIGHDAGAASPQSLTLERLIRLIKVAGKTPVERDTLYNQLRSF